MIKIKAEKLTPEAFAPYGTYTNVLDPEGYHIGGESFMTSTGIRQSFIQTVPFPSDCLL